MTYKIYFSPEEQSFTLVEKGVEPSEDLVGKNAVMLVQGDYENIEEAHKAFNEVIDLIHTDGDTVQEGHEE